jgi:hypothetical protein
MTADGRLHRLLHRWGLRLRLVESVRLGLWGAVFGLIVGVLLATAARLAPLLWRQQLIGWVLLAASAGALGSSAYAWLRPRSAFQLARTFDRRFDLAQRLTTALELASGRLQTAPAMAAAQQRDTFTAAARVDPRAALPLRLPRRALIALVGLAATLALLLWLPNPQEAVLEQRAAVRAALEEQTEALEAAQAEIAANDALTEPEREALLDALEEALAALQEPGVTPEEAVAALSEAERALAPLRNSDAAAARRGLERLSGELQDSDLTRDIAEALAAGDYEAAADALTALSGDGDERLTRAEELELGEQLAQAADALQTTNPKLAQQFEEIAEAIQQGNTNAAREGLQAAAEQLAAEGAEAARQAAVEDTLSAVQQGRAAIGAEAGLPTESPGTGQGDAQAGMGGQIGGNQPGAGAPVHSEDAGTGAPYDELYVPERLGEGGEGVELPREDEDGVPIGASPGGPPTGGEARVSYRQIYADYAEEAGAALERDYVPLGMKQYVRDYFSALEPAE